MNEPLKNNEYGRFISEEELSKTIARETDPVNQIARERKIEKTESEETILKSIEKQIKENKYSNKEELSQQLLKLKKSGMSSMSSEKMNELLNLYDNVNKKEELPLDVTNYKTVSLDNNDLIVSTEENRILTEEGKKIEFNEEFKQRQNEILAHSPDGQTNAKEVFDNMAKHEKEELTLIPLTEAIMKDDVEREILNKIRFFLTNTNINPNSFTVDIKTCVFYNIETYEVYEVRKNENTGKYEIFRGSEKTYGQKASETEEIMLKNESDTEQLPYEHKLNNHKKLVRKKDNPPYMGNAAFTKVGFLVINIISFILLITMAILLRK